MNFIHDLTNLINYFFGLFVELSFLVFPRSISQLTRFGLLARIIFFLLLIGSILMTLFPFDSFLYSHEKSDNIREYLCKVFERQLINSIIPPVTRNEADKYQNSTNLYKRKCEFLIIVNRSRNVNEPLSTLKSDASREFKANDVECEMYERDDGTLNSECNEYESDKMDFDICGNLELIEKSDTTVEPFEDSDGDMISLMATASIARFSRFCDTEASAFIEEIESTNTENVRVSESSRIVVKISSRNIGENKEMINKVIRENSGEIEEIMDVINPDSTLDNYRDHEIGRTSENSEILLAVVERSENSFRSSDTS